MYKRLGAGGRSVKYFPRLEYIKEKGPCLKEFFHAPSLFKVCRLFFMRRGRNYIPKKDISADEIHGSVYDRVRISPV